MRRSSASLRRPLALLVAALLVPALGACGSSSNGSASGGLRVVAAENFWGSIAKQLAGTKASVQSIIVNPNQDPHMYNPTAADARAVATAQLVIFNGVGYDPWGPKLVAANPSSGRVVLTVGDLFGLKQGDNPHRWYSPANVDAVVTAITAALKKLDPGDGLYFDHRHQGFENSALAPYHQLIAQIKARYSGVPVGASESIFALLAPALGLKLITPPGYLKAVSEGTEVTPQDEATTHRQVDSGQVKVWVYNSQNATPDVQRLNAEARARQIPITTVTETLTPPGYTFEQWQVAQLRRLEAALHKATGR
jgi:zinc/manganese transport system substrate-binding protein